MTNPKSAFERLLADRQDSTNLKASASPGGYLHTAAMAHIQPISYLARRSSGALIAAGRATAMKFQGAFSPLDPNDGQMEDALIHDIHDAVGKLLPEAGDNYLAQAITNTVLRAVTMGVVDALHAPGQTWSPRVSRTCHSGCYRPWTR